MSEGKPVDVIDTLSPLSYRHYVLAWATTWQLSPSSVRGRAARQHRKATGTCW